MADELRVGEVWGIRGWYVKSDALLGRSDHTYLTGLGYTHGWKRGYQDAALHDFCSHCYIGGTPPGRGCTCGYWMMTDRNLDQMWGYYPSAVGLVKGWGRIQQHKYGFRVQYIEPVIIFRVPHGRFLPAIVNQQFASLYGARYGGIIPLHSHWVTVVKNLRCFGYYLREGGDCEYRNSREGNRGVAGNDTDKYAWLRAAGYAAGPFGPYPG